VVVAVGPANVGKSTLTNALAKQQVSLVADVAGTTRDHVGVTLNLGGLTVRWIDAPGVRRAGTRDGGVLSDVDRSASALLRPIAASAALVVSCGDSASGFLGDAELRELGVERGQALLRCGTRVDRDDDMPDRKRVTADVRTAALRREGLEALASAVRRAIVPGWAIEDERPWVFHPALSGPTAAGASTVCRG
jgi:tRNA modification GTPase